jgi:hypothetical protein
MDAGGTAGGGGGFDPCPASDNCKILPLGDSITYGSPTNNGGYRVELFTKAINDAKHITFVGSQSDGPNMVAGVPFPKNNEGHPGWTISQIDGIATTSMALKDSPPIVLLHIGTNDMCSGSAGAPTRLAQLVDKIIAALPNSLLAVSSIIPFPACASAVTTYDAAVPGIVQQRAAQGNVIYVEMFKGFPNNGLGSDGIHPNDNIGYPWMGDTWYSAIKSYLHWNPERSRGSYGGESTSRPRPSARCVRRPRISARQLRQLRRRLGPSGDARAWTRAAIRPRQAFGRE